MQKPRAAVAWDDICLSYTLGNITVDSLLLFVVSAPLNKIYTWPVYLALLSQSQRQSQSLS